MKKITDNDIVFVFKNPIIGINLDGSIYNDEEAKKLHDAVLCFSDKIMIDKTYVDFKDTKYRKTFMTEDGWNEIVNLVINTQFCKKATKEQLYELAESYKAMIVCYIDGCLQDIGFNTAGISMTVTDSPFDVEYLRDTGKEWKTYVGRWQDWTKNN